MDALDATTLAQVSGVSHLLTLDTTPWYKKRNLRSLYLCLVPAALGVEMTSGYDGSVLNGLQAVQPWNDYFGSPNGAILGVITAAFSIGAAVALPAVPWTNDRLGRKLSIVIGSCIIVAGVILQTASVNIAMFLVARILLGMGIPFAISGASQLIAELAYPRERPVITGLFNESWYAGSVLAAAVTLGTYAIPNNWSWRIPSLLQLLPSLLCLTFIWFVPESPRWLISRDRSDEALAILIKYHAEGNPDDPFVQAEYRQIRETITLEVEANRHKWAELFRTKGNRRRILIAGCVGLFSQWSGNGLVSYYLAKVLTTIGITNHRTQNVLNLGLQLWNLTTGVTGALLTKYFRRRTQYLIAFSMMTIIFACWTGASADYANTKNAQAGGAVVGMIFLYYTFYNLMMPLTYIYITEVFPFIHRAKGVAITQFFSRGASAFNQFVNPIGLQHLGWKYYIVYVAWLAVETLIIGVLYAETKGAMLEEVAIVFDGGDATVGAMDITTGKTEVVHVEQVGEKV